MPTCKVDDGTLINFEVHGDTGSKETLLLLPGLLGSAGSHWQSFVPALEGNFRVVLMDHRGHGRSENKQRQLVPEQMVQDMVGLLNHLGVSAVHVAGYSIGGYLGLMLALNQPRLVQSLLMQSTKFYWTKEAVERTKAELDPDVMGQKVPGYANQLAQEHGGGRWRTLVRQTADLVGRLSNEGVTEGMAARLQIPVLVSVGDRDEMVKLPECLRLSRVFPKGGLLVLPNTQHPFASLPLVPLVPMMQYFHRLHSGRRR